MLNVEHEAHAFARRSTQALLKATPVSNASVIVMRLDDTNQILPVGGRSTTTTLYKIRS